MALVGDALPRLKKYKSDLANSLANGGWQPSATRQVGYWTRPELWFGVEPPAGIEPATPSLPWMCSAD